MKMSSLISVICTTYNRPDALSAVLMGLMRQTDTTFEVVIADDGSTIQTQEVISKYQSLAKFRIVHAWQEDRGFRAAAARNLAFSQTQGEYILLLDGDCIPSPHWIEHHRHLAEKHWSVPGQRILLIYLIGLLLISESSTNKNLLIDGNLLFALVCSIAHFGENSHLTIGGKQEVAIGEYGAKISAQLMALTNLLSDGGTKTRILLFDL